MGAVAPTDELRLEMRQRPSGRPVMFQRWSELLFLHWKIEPAEIQRRLPEGLHVDTFGGEAWIGVVPFFMERIRPVGLPAVPWLSWFLELNVRTYVHDDLGRPGVWFFSLDCNQPLAVEFARKFFHLPYQHARMSAERIGGEILYHSRRRGAGHPIATFRYARTVDAVPAGEGTLEWFLAERYLLFSTNRAGRIFTGQVNHTPYRIAPASCLEWSVEPLRLNGFADPGRPPDSMLLADAVDVAVFPLRRA
ncbi:DUF2071 domain-containing protein [Luteolibacter sp. SL250]|uniref:YqjF family protein n=1 Tax=Luteolibacter sp. SL250 TaxID=2995170 RepID=UPI00226EF333|nr:DUF2071 domain-containing protein [Luteolibacter sp. SL250]WAC21268.1 DUF2071 domain-containing protein [Luteolibacter sp. SL250]